MDDGKGYTFDLIRDGEVVTGCSFYSSPPTHEAKKDCYITTEGQHSASPDLFRIYQSVELD